MGRGVLSPNRAEALTRIDPWWRPPWHLCWQRSYEHACQQLQQVGGGVGGGLSTDGQAGAGVAAHPAAPLENALDLNQHPPGTLPRHASYLHQRTAGRIGSLARLIRQAAITAICDGTERITKKTLDAIQLDHLAEEARRPRTRQSPTTA